MNYLSHAAGLASQIDPHKTAPNPRVGCVIVQNDKIVAQGVHERFGEGHAEVNALVKALLSKGVGGIKTEGSLHNHEIYITLEPCDHFPGKQTPSCTELIISAKPKKVVIGSLDPHFNGRNVERLMTSGIDVEIEENEACKALNPFFEKYITTKLPYLTLKIAQSLDGKIVSPHGKWITNEISRRRVHQMRAQYSAIFTTTKTIIEDNPYLTCRLNTFQNSPPHLIILGTQSCVPETFHIYETPERNIHFFDTRDLSDVLHQCHAMKIDSIMTECGRAMNTALLEEGLVDEIHLFVAPQIFGGHVKNSFQKTIEMHDFRLENIEELAGDLLLIYKK